MASRHAKTEYVPIEYEAPTVRGMDIYLRWQTLSERELQIARLMGEGKSDKEIARSLRLSFRTITSYNRNLFAKLGTRSRVQVAILAQQFK